jgi:predicted DNA-binding antitoxin AbrB/MazE fold protein
MSVKVIQAEYDGKVLIPSEPLDLPAGVRVRLVVEVEADEQLRRLHRLWKYFEDHPVDAPSLSDEDLRRENLYEEQV